MQWTFLRLTDWLTTTELILKCQLTQSGRVIHYSTPGHHRNNRMRLKKLFVHLRKTCLTTLFWPKSHVFTGKFTLWQPKELLSSSSRTSHLLTSFMFSTENRSYQMWRFLLKSCKAKIVGFHKKTRFSPNIKVVREFKPNTSALLSWRDFCWKLVLPAHFVWISHYSMGNSLRDNLERCPGTLFRQLFFSQVFLFPTENPSCQRKSDLTVSAQNLLSLFLLLA
jgi:hypothetical protein